MASQTTNKALATRNNYKFSEAADERQANVCKMFPNDNPLSNPQFCDHFMQWVTFFRRNLHRCAIDYLGIKLYPYQSLMLSQMSTSRFFVVVASRAVAKSFVIALFSCVKCILFPNSKVVIASGSRTQAKLLVTDKIQKELMSMSPVLCKEIDNIKNNQNEVVVTFRNNSTITVVTANDNARGHRSTVIVREEFRQIKKFIDDSVLSPFQIVRQAPYIHDEFYANIKELQEESVDIYISSSWFDDGGNWMWSIVDQTYDGMMKGDGSCLLAFDESIPLKHNIKTMRYFQTEKKKQDPMTWQIEFLNARLKENRSAFFTYTMLNQNQRAKKPFYPRTTEDFRAGKKNPYDIPKQKGEIRVLACDMAFVERKNNDNSVFSCIRLLPERSTYTNSASDDITVDNGYRRIVCYLEAVQGGDVTRQATRIRELFDDFGADYLVLDMRNAGSNAA